MMTVTFVRTKVSKEVRHTYEAAIASGEVPHSASTQPWTMFQAIRYLLRRLGAMQVVRYRRTVLNVFV
jgi:hypothetical protein